MPEAIKFKDPIGKMSVGTLRILIRRKSKKELTDLIKDVFEDYPKLFKHLVEEGEIVKSDYPQVIMQKDKENIIDLLADICQNWPEVWEDLVESGRIIDSSSHMFPYEGENCD